MKGAKQSSSIKQPPRSGEKEERGGREGGCQEKEGNGVGRGGRREWRGRWGAPRVLSALLPALHPYLEWLEDKDAVTHLATSAASLAGC